jgi:hypothetical protein
VVDRREATGPAAPRPATQVRYNDEAGLAFTTTATATGDIAIEARNAELTFHKIVSAGGRFTLELGSARDKVGLRFDEHAVTVSRGKKTVALTFSRATEDDYDSVRRLLADSRAVLLLRTAAAAFERDESDSAESAAVVMADAVVGALSGDVGAVGRTSRRLSRHARGGLRNIAAGTSCYESYEQGVTRADYEYWQCNWDVYPNPFLMRLCQVRFIVWAESLWFSFLTCFGF